MTKVVVGNLALVTDGKSVFIRRENRVMGDLYDAISLSPHELDELRVLLDRAEEQRPPIRYTDAAEFVVEGARALVRDIRIRTEDMALVDVDVSPRVYEHVCARYGHHASRMWRNYLTLDGGVEIGYKRRDR